MLPKNSHFIVDDGAWVPEHEGRRVVRAICRFIRKRGYCPTIHSLTKEQGWSPLAVGHNVRRLLALGYLARWETQTDLRPTSLARKYGSLAKPRLPSHNRLRRLFLSARVHTALDDKARREGWPIPLDSHPLPVIPKKNPESLFA